MTGTGSQVPKIAPQPCADWALFLDIDGTLLDIAETPQAVHVPVTLVPELARVSAGLDGALAVVSGRPLAQIDKLISPIVLPCASDHGAVIRIPGGDIRFADTRLAVPLIVKSKLQAAVRNWQGVFVEEKPYSAVIHFRQAPEREHDAKMIMDRVLTEVPDEFEVLPASMAFEIRNRAITKGVAVSKLMSLAPFTGRIPVFVGDDVTDEDGFRTAREMGGIALNVNVVFGGRASEVRRWLETFPSR